MSPCVTVIIPVYNVASSIHRCLNSILAQTYQNLEIILIDDGSTDASGAICDEFARNDRRIKVIHQDNRGLSGARNVALNIATGDFVAFVDSDDSVAPDLIQRLIELRNQFSTKIAICSFQEIVESAKPRPESPPQPDKSVQISNAQARSASTTATLIDMLCDRGFTVSAWGKLYARDLFQNIRFPEGKLYEDVGTTYKLILLCDQIAISPAPLYNYYQTPDSITQRGFSLQKLDLITLTDQMCAAISAWSKTRPASERSQLEYLTKKRRMHARFSILRQMVLINQKTLRPSDRQAFFSHRKAIIRYLKTHQADVLRNPLATRRDQVAMRTLLLGLPVFRLAWRLYAKRKAANLSR